MLNNNSNSNGTHTHILIQTTDQQKKITEWHDDEIVRVLYIFNSDSELCFIQWLHDRYDCIELVTWPAMGLEVLIPGAMGWPSVFCLFNKKIICNHVIINKWCRVTFSELTSATIRRGVAGVQFPVHTHTSTFRTHAFHMVGMRVVDLDHLVVFAYLICINCNVNCCSEHNNR